MLCLHCRLIHSLLHTEELLYAVATAKETCGAKGNFFKRTPNGLVDEMHTHNHRHLTQTQDGQNEKKKGSGQSFGDTSKSFSAAHVLSCWIGRCEHTTTHNANVNTIK